MRGSDGDGWDFFMWGGGGGLVGSGDGVAINRQGVVVTNWCANGRHKHSSIEVLYNILNYVAK